MISKFSIVSDKKLKIISVKVFSLKDKVFVKYLISYKKEHDLDFLGGQIPVEIDFDYEEIIKLKNMFVL